MKKIIALWGRGHTGKTQTLNLVIDMLQVAAEGGQVPAPKPTEGDRRRTIHYNGQIISISTLGDNEDELLKNEAYFEDQKCDIAITAARSHGKTHKVINAMALKNSCPPPIWIEKKVGPPNDQLNMIDAKEIIGKI